MKFVFKGIAVKQLRKLDESVKLRILKKLHFYSTQKDPLDFAEPLKGVPHGG